MSGAGEEPGGGDLRDRVEAGVRRRWTALDRWVDARFGDEDEAVAHRFKQDAVAIEEAPVPISANAALYVILALLVIAVLWSIFGMVDRIVVAPGKIATRTSLIVMSPFTTSRIQEVTVKAGDHVHKGQTLVLFDPAFAQADVAALAEKLDTLSAQAGRIEAQMDNRSFAAGAGASPARITQAQIFAQESSDYTAEMKQRESRLDQIASQLAVDQSSLPGLRKQNDMAQQVISMQDRLQKENAASTLDVLRAQSNAVDVDLKLKSTQGDIEKLSGQRAEALQERQAYLDKWRSDHNHQLVQTRQDLSEARETLNKAQRMKDFTRLVAPADGVVLEVADRSTGSVMREAETLVTLVPDGASLYVEANVPSRDISYLKLGDAVRVKLESYPFQRYGTLNGVLDVISPDSMPLKADDAKSELVYKVQVRLTDRLDDLAGRGIHLRPGLVASAEIKTGKRSIASYVLNPILRTADESLREP